MQLTLRDVPADLERERAGVNPGQVAILLHLGQHLT